MKTNIHRIVPHRRPNSHSILAKIGKVSTAVFLNNFLRNSKSLYSNTLQETRAVRVHWPHKAPTSLVSACLRQMSKRHLMLVSFWIKKTNEVLILLGFKFHPGHEFQFGKVFRILWAEPMGSHGTQITEAVHSRSQKYGEGFHHKIRRFLIVKTFKAHCICL